MNQNQEKKSLRRLRMERELKLVELARMAQVSASALWYWENGQRTPGTDNLEKLATALDLSFDEVLRALRVSRDLSQGHSVNQENILVPAS